MEKHKEELEDFFDKTLEKITEFKNGKKLVTVGKFTIQINKTCEITLDEKPTFNPVEYDCLKGSYDGELLARTVAKLTASAPRNPLLVFNHLAECELVADLKVSFSIYNECEQQEFKDAYMKLYGNIKQEM